MSNILNAITLAEFKAELNVETLTLAESNKGNLHLIVNNKSVASVAADIDLDLPINILQMENAKGTWRFAVNEQTWETKGSL